MHWSVLSDVDCRRCVDHAMTRPDLLREGTRAAAAECRRRHRDHG